ncbi:MAG TPA: ferritin-like domain-containing protein [Candidatus Angelobacter sp.]|jgi:hypothetical protein|nr:ferritin-like domain-containing protein [Candidatus Angelobacter sp.]
MDVDPARVWSVPSAADTIVTWEYDEGRERLLRLYEKGKRRQWDGADRLDWTTQVDPDNPLGTRDDEVPIFGSPTWSRLGAADRSTLVRHLAAWQFSQFLHGEQGGLICAARIIQTVPDIDSKYFAATQVIDEARHAEVFARFVREKIGLTYPIDAGLRALLDDVLSDRRWDITYLGVQVLIEGLGLAAYQIVRDSTTNPLARAITAYVMEDEARHVAFGRIALADHYRELSTAELDEREEFCIEALAVMRQRFLCHQVWAMLGYDVDECVQAVETSAAQQAFRRLLFSRIVPTLRDIGLLSERVRGHLAGMDINGFESVDLDRAERADALSARIADASRAPG